MILTDSQITTRIGTDDLLKDHDADNVRNCGYTLRVGKVFAPLTGREVLLRTAGKPDLPVQWNLPAGEVLVVMTKEIIKMPTTLCASYTPLNRLAASGVMLLNSAIVEPGYEGPLSCFVLNFSSKEIQISPNDPIAKIVFHEISSAPAHMKPLVMKSEDYEVNLAKAAMKFTPSFMDVAGVEERAVEKAKNSMKNWAISGGIFVVFLLAWSTFEPVLSKWIWKNVGVMSDERRAEDQRLLDRSVELESRLRLLMDQSSSRDEISGLREEIEKLKKQSSPPGSK